MDSMPVDPNVETIQIKEGPTGRYGRQNFFEVGSVCIPEGHLARVVDVNDRSHDRDVLFVRDRGDGSARNMLDVMKDLHQQGYTHVQPKDWEYICQSDDMLKPDLFAIYANISPADNEKWKVVRANVYGTHSLGTKFFTTESVDESYKPFFMHDAADLGVQIERLTKLAAVRERRSLPSFAVEWPEDGFAPGPEYDS